MHPRWNGPVSRPAALLALALASLPGPARADSCRPATETAASSKGGRFALEARYDDRSESWRATLRDTRTGQGAEGALARVTRHAHHRAFVSDDGSRVVLFEPRAGRGDEDRVLVYDGSLRLLRSFGLGELLTPDELGRVGRSVSHVRFSEVDPDRLADAWIEGGTFAFRAAGGRVVRVDLEGPRIVADPAGGPGLDRGVNE